MMLDYLIASLASSFGQQIHALYNVDVISKLVYLIMTVI
jgi:hypothetical protein